MKHIGNAIRFGAILTGAAASAWIASRYLSARPTAEFGSGGITPGQGYRRGVTTAFDYDRFEPWRFDDGNPTPLEPVEQTPVDSARGASGRFDA